MYKLVTCCCTVFILIFIIIIIITYLWSSILASYTRKHLSSAKGIRPKRSCRRRRCFCCCCCCCCCSSSSSSSYSGATTSIFEPFALLITQFPLTATLDAASPILYFQFLHVLSYTIFQSVLWSP